MDQWEPLACFPSTRWSYLGVIGDSETLSVFLMPSLLSNWLLSLQRTQVHEDRLLEIIAGFTNISGYSAIILIQNVSRAEVI